MSLNRMTTAEIARLVNGRLAGAADIIIHDVAKIEEAGPDNLTFVSNPRYARFLETTRAGAALVAVGTTSDHLALIEVPDPYAAFLQMLEHFHPIVSWLSVGVHPTAAIDPSAIVAEGVSIGAHCYVGPRASVGKGTKLYPRAVVAADVVIGCDCEIHSGVSLRERVVLGDRVVVQDGAVIGSDGFGFAPTAQGYRKIPQLGRVVIGNDVEIGANSTIDRATLGETVVGAGTKLDNLVQVAHNASIGAHTVIAAQSGISGSARIGDRCRIGGQVGVVGHLTIGDDVSVGAQSGVANDVEQGVTISGSPARAHSLWKRIEASLSRLPDLLRRVRRLETAVFEADKKDSERTTLS